MNASSAEATTIGQKTVSRNGPTTGDVDEDAAEEEETGVTSEERSTTASNNMSRLIDHWKAPLPHATKREREVILLFSHMLAPAMKISFLLLTTRTPH